MSFSSGSSISNPYSTATTTIVGEPDIREEIHRIIHNEKRGSYLVYRRARRDEKGTPILSPTRQNNRSRETNFDIPTNISDSMGYLFDDIVTIGLLNLSLPDHLAGKVQMPGDIRNDNQLVYFPYDVLKKITGSETDMPDPIDQILFPKRDLEGDVLSPLQIEAVYNITSVEPFRLDQQGRVEFFRVTLKSKAERNFQL